MTTDLSSNVEVLSRSESLDLLATASHGHLALSIDALPVIVPVSLTVTDTGLVIRTEATDSLHHALNGAVVAVAIQGTRASARDAWQVLVRGIAHPAGPVDGAVAERLADGPHAAGTAAAYIMVSTDLVDGRRWAATDLSVPPATGEI